jgi:hypothetical protein
MQDYYVARGSHETPEEGRCAMEWVAHIAGEPHTDKPECVSDLLRQFVIHLNDELPDRERQKLRPYLARMIGTRDDGHEEARYFAFFRYLRENPPQETVQRRPVAAEGKAATIWAATAGNVAGATRKVPVELLEELLPMERLENVPQWRGERYVRSPGLAAALQEHGRRVAGVR